MRGSTIVLWAFCASKSQAVDVFDEEDCSVATRTIGQITKLEYAFASENTTSLLEQPAEATSGLDSENSLLSSLLSMELTVPSTGLAETSTTSTSSAGCSHAPEVDDFACHRCQAPGAGSIALESLKKKRSVANIFACIDECMGNSACMGASYQKGTRNCILFQLITGLAALSGYDTYIKTAAVAVTTTTTTTKRTTTTTTTGRTSTSTTKTTTTSKTTPKQSGTTQVSTSRTTTKPTTIGGTSLHLSYIISSSRQSTSTLPASSITFTKITGEPAIISFSISSSSVIINRSSTASPREVSLSGTPYISHSPARSVESSSSSSNVQTPATRGSSTITFGTPMLHTSASQTLPNTDASMTSSLPVSSPSQTTMTTSVKGSDSQSATGQQRSSEQASSLTSTLSLSQPSSGTTSQPSSVSSNADSSFPASSVQISSSLATSSSLASTMPESKPPTGSQTSSNTITLASSSVSTSFITSEEPSSTITAISPSFSSSSISTVSSTLSISVSSNISAFSSLAPDQTSTSSTFSTTTDSSFEPTITSFSTPQGGSSSSNNISSTSTTLQTSPSSTSSLPIAMVFNVVSGTVNTFSFARFGTISSIVSTSPQVSFVNVTFDNSGIEVDPPAGYIGPVMVTLVVMPTEGGDSSTILAQLNIVAPSSSSLSLSSSSSFNFSGYSSISTSISTSEQSSLSTASTSLSSQATQQSTTSTAASLQISSSTGQSPSSTTSSLILSIGSTTSARTSSQPRSSSLTSSSPSASPTVPSCGFTGYDTGTNIGYYADASLATYFGCSSLCNANAACLSFAINPSAPACILYEHDLSVDLYSASSPNTFYLRGGFCPPATTTTTTSYSPTPTGKFPYCPAGLSPYNVTQVTAGTQQPYTPCIAGKSASACMHDIDGNNYCNDCISCLNGWACASDADCPAGYACIVGSDCPGNGTTGVAMCLYMLYNPAYNCYAAA